MCRQPLAKEAVADVDFVNDVACLIAAMREVGRVPSSAHNRHEDTWWSQEFLAVEKALVARGLLLPREPAA